MSNDDYTHRWTFQQKLLHPNIQHINCSPDISHEELSAVNKMAERISNMTTKELDEMLCKKFKRNNL